MNESMSIDLNPLLITLFVAQLLLNIFIIDMWNDRVFQKFHGVYQGEQKIHEGFVPRFGGFVMLIIFILLYFFEAFSDHWLRIIKHLLLCLTPLILVTFLEDVYNNILPLARLFFIFLSSVLVLSLGDFQLPSIELPWATQFLVEHHWVWILLLTIALAAMVNAFNLVDGANGLLLSNFLTIFLCLRMMAGVVDDTHWQHLINLLIMICIIQLLFNFPKARIFCGDLGAYAFGFITAILTIIFFGQHPEFLTWQAILILFYPAWELLFTICRRFISKKNPFEADRAHLHQLIFTVLQSNNYNTLWSNAMSTIILMPLWASALIWLSIHGAQLSFVQTFLGLGLQIILYLFCYFSFYKLAPNESH